MAIELILVLEIRYHSENITSPQTGPFWEYPSEWNKYNAACYLEAGFKDPFIPYLPGSAFVKLADISENNLFKIIEDKVSGFVKGEFSREQMCPLSGGFVLNIDGQDVYFPQCCADLGTISFWENISEGENSYDEGHPTPALTFTIGEITFDFTDNEFEGPFMPPPLFEKITIDRFQLKAAVEKVKARLYKFAAIVEEFNVSEGWNIPEIDKLLVWGEE